MLRKRRLLPRASQKRQHAAVVFRVGRFQREPPGARCRRLKETRIRINPTYDILNQDIWRRLGVETIPCRGRDCGSARCLCRWHDLGDAQVDFGEALAETAAVERKIHFFAMDLPHNDACFVPAYPVGNRRNVL
jgi:hypothetical protein